MFSLGPTFYFAKRVAKRVFFFSQSQMNALFRPNLKTKTLAFHFFKTTNHFLYLSQQLNLNMGFVKAL